MSADADARAAADIEGVAGGISVLRPAALADVPGLVAGITARSRGGGATGGRGAAGDPRTTAGDSRATATGRGGADDFGLATGGSAWDVSGRYETLAAGLGFPVVSVCRQVHGARLVPTEHAPRTGMWIPGSADGFIGTTRGRLFAVTVADCVPVYLVEPASGAFGLLHAGWRGAAAGILGRALTKLTELAELAKRHGGPPSEVRVHLGPAICGGCYEVGPEVPGAFGRTVEGKSRFDLRAELEREARGLGVRNEHITISSLCTRCDGDRLYSHRGGGELAGRMAAYIGWKE